MLDKQLIIREIAQKYRVVLSEDDPIFSVIYLHDVIFDQYTAKMDSTVRALAMDIEGITARYRENSRELAEQIVGKAVEVARTEIRTAGNESAEEWRTQMEMVLQTKGTQLSSARSASRVAVVAAGLSVLALVGGVVNLVLWA